jgi:hypothetical protein
MSHHDCIKALIFALPRTGSTSILKALNAHPNIRCSCEPFTFPAMLRSREQIRERLATLRRDYFAVKHVWHPSGWPFGPQMELNWFLLTEGAECVVLLRRNNVLKRVVSCALCMQADVWYVENNEALDNYRRRKFDPLNIEGIRRSVQRELALLEEGRQRLRDANVRWTEMVYEDLYGVAGAQREAFGRLFEFLGIASVSPPWPEVSRIIDQPVARLNDDDVYKSVPNIEEVEARIGGNATGWLFR